MESSLCWVRFTSYINNSLRNRFDHSTFIFGTNASSDLSEIPFLKLAPFGHLDGAILTQTRKYLLYIPT